VFKNISISTFFFFSSAPKRRSTINFFSLLFEILGLEAALLRSVETVETSEKESFFLLLLLNRQNVFHAKEDFYVLPFASLSWFRTRSRG
jgi:hypothetical protein